MLEQNQPGRPSKWERDYTYVVPSRWSVDESMDDCQVVMAGRRKPNAALRNSLKKAIAEVTEDIEAADIDEGTREELRANSNTLSALAGRLIDEAPADVGGAFDGLMLENRGIDLEWASHDARILLHAAIDGKVALSALSPRALDGQLRQIGCTLDKYDDPSFVWAWLRSLMRSVA